MRSIFLTVLSLLLIASAVVGCLKEEDGTAPALDLPTLLIEDMTVTEDDVDQIIQIPVRLQGTNTTNVVVNFAIVADSIMARIDFETLTSGKLVFGPNDTEQIIELRIIGDEVREPTKALQIQLYGVVNATYAQDIMTLTLVDDDDPTVGLVIPTAGYMTPTEYPGKTLVWADEFDADTLNLNDWTYELGDGCPDLCGWGNNELQFYRENNTAIEAGNLIITAKRQNFGGKDYTSSRLITKGKQQFKFGRIDIRAVCPGGKGLWPALWMLGSNIDAVSWPSCGEIDIMELTGDLPNRVLGTAHFGADLSQHTFKSGTKFLSGSDNFQEKFHVFSIDWKVDEIQFLVDDELYFTMDPSKLDGQPWPFNKHFFFIFNVAVGGNLPGNPDGTTAFPQRMIVDYVRVFQ